MSDSATKRVFVQSFGCRASQADGAAIEASLADSGYVAVREAAAVPATDVEMETWAARSAAV